MRERSLKQVKKELRQAGASSTEVAELSVIAARLPLLKDYKHIKDDGAKRRQPRVLKLVAGGLVGLAAGVFLILLAQPVLPTSWLYPVQKFSDSIAVDVRPQYRATVMMKRAQQINSLVAEHASSDTVLATLADYADEAKAYKAMPHTNYAALEFCKTNLQQADSIAPPIVKQAIQNSLRSLETT